jgi:hypothetical protein
MTVPNVNIGLPGTVPMPNSGTIPNQVVSMPITIPNQAVSIPGPSSGAIGTGIIASMSNSNVASTGMLGQSMQPHMIPPTFPQRHIPPSVQVSSHALGPVGIPVSQQPVVLNQQTLSNTNQATLVHMVQTPASVGQSQSLMGQPQPANPTVLAQLPSGSLQLSTSQPNIPLGQNPMNIGNPQLNNALQQSQTSVAMQGQPMIPQSSIVDFADSHMVDQSAGPATGSLQQSQPHKVIWSG